MNNNDIVSSLRYALNLRDTEVAEVFSLGGQNVGPNLVRDLLRKDNEADFVPCSQELLTAFLDGLIVAKRGVQESKDGKAPPRILVTTNNVALKKLRIAFNLQESDMLSILEFGGFPLSKAELSALFRKEGHRHYRECGNQVLRYFLKGLARKERGEDIGKDDASAR